ncbi:hypothetical protein RSOLAG22IIIB_03532 [Rhizoctonia solani]|uniref:Uncharacterized protein n=1 Tax=Rhizoctonia solani TaxID=456999 RepID=A0A0K6FQF5_9AGAM|nr:hypothetical protein RSOLAG22IIIB_03532 [Rhizoctonia solani]
MWASGVMCLVPVVKTWNVWAFDSRRPASAREDQSVFWKADVAEDISSTPAQGKVRTVRRKDRPASRGTFVAVS